MVQGHTEIPGAECHRHEKGYGKETTRFRVCNFCYIWHGHRWVCRQTMAVLLHMCSGFPTKIIEQMIMTSLNDIMRISHMTEGGKYKRRA